MMYLRLQDYQIISKCLGFVHPVNNELHALNCFGVYTKKGWIWVKSWHKNFFIQ